MKINIEGRRNETKFALLTVVVIAMLVSLLANVLFVELYTDHEVVFTWVIVLCLLISMIVAYLAILSKAESGKSSATILLTFLRSEARFVDLPFSPPSVNVRSLFEKMYNAEERSRLALQDQFGSFWDTDFHRFVDNAVQCVLLRLIVLDKEVAARCMNGTERHRTALPTGISNNPCMSAPGPRWRDFRDSLPDRFFVETFGSSDRFIRVVCDVGSVEFSWRLAVRQGGPDSAPYMTLFGYQSIRDHT